MLGTIHHGPLVKGGDSQTARALTLQNSRRFNGKTYDVRRKVYGLIIQIS